MFPCKDCTDRHIGCHSTCEKYIKEKAKHEQLKSDQQLNKDMQRYKIERHNKCASDYAKHKKRQGKLYKWR